jgi:hypothetical protein
VIGWGGPHGLPTAMLEPMLPVMGTTRPGKRRPIITTDLAVLGSSAASAARLREEHLWPVVLDSMTLIREAIHNAIPDGKPSALMDALVVGTVRLYGKPDLLEEVAEHLAEVAARKDYDLALAREVLAVFVSRLRLVDPSGVTILPDEERFARVAARRKPDGRSDEPTARISRLLDPSIVLTTDDDLLDNGFGVWYEPGERLATWTAAAYTLKDRSFASQMDSGAKMTGLAVGLPVKTGVGVVQLARAHPRAALGASALAVALGFATRRSPRWEAARKALAEGFSAVMDDMVSRIPADPAQQQRASAEAIAQLEAYRTAHASPGSPVAIVARTLAIAPWAGLTPREIYDSTGHRFAVRPVLDAHPRLFTADAADHWFTGVQATEPA